MWFGLLTFLWRQRPIDCKELDIVGKDFSVPYAGMDFIEVYADELERVNDASVFGL